MSGRGDIIPLDDQYVIALDVGSSTVRSIIFNQNVKVVGEESVSVSYYVSCYKLLVYVDNSHQSIVLNVY